MEGLQPLLLFAVGSGLCVAGERAMLAGANFRAIVTAAPGVALIAMSVLVPLLGLWP
ncbi:hypothetical protein HCN51_31655 [Nonomuraea sp. FMUSA5-5]|uniref:Uncharacterized protein n=1 Tax=Nonomuraea composti TaxID=2720023 RepID=A0ABX1B8T4_9ACTN|nr:hypothetical protein [Nonomuraea sp. FMUSA5-5]NJP93941.1 hypothetical protein [Nonomuraea sp. FMUSA5-5]